jgi:hypothetical protein
MHAPLMQPSLAVVLTLAMQPLLLLADGCFVCCRATVLDVPGKFKVMPRALQHVEGAQHCSLLLLCMCVHVIQQAS